MEDRKNFLQIMEELKSYKVEFDENSAMKPKIYLIDYIVGEINRRSVIIITHDKCIF